MPSTHLPNHLSIYYLFNPSTSSYIQRLDHQFKALFIHSSIFPPWPYHSTNPRSHPRTQARYLLWREIHGEKGERARSGWTRHHQQVSTPDIGGVHARIPRWGQVTRPFPHAVDVLVEPVACWQGERKVVGYRWYRTVLDLFVLYFAYHQNLLFFHFLWSFVIPLSPPPLPLPPTRHSHPSNVSKTSI